MKFTNKKSGFTLVEILIVVIILGILAAVVVPQFMDASSDAKSSSLDSNIQILQSQFELYKAQHLDSYPWEDANGALDGDANIALRLTSRTDEDGTVNAAGDYGPYMSEVPGNPHCSNDPVQFRTDAAASTGEDWAITIATGKIDDGQ